MQWAWGHGKCIKNFDWKHDGKRPLGRPRHRQKDNITQNLGKHSGRTKIGFILLRTETGGKLMWTQYKHSVKQDD